MEKTRELNAKPVLTASSLPGDFPEFALLGAAGAPPGGKLEKPKRTSLGPVFRASDAQAEPQNRGQGC